MCGRIMVWIVVIIAIVMGVLATMAGNLSDHWLSMVGIIARFFDVTLPILGVGALLKYLCSCHGKGHCGHCGHHEEMKKEEIKK